VPGLSPKLPLSVDKIDGYALTKNFKQVAQQNLKMVILTAPGERVMDPNFGVGLRSFLFENASDTTFSLMEERIREQTRIYVPYITIQSINFLSSENDFSKTKAPGDSLSNYLKLEIKYSIPSMFISSTLTLEI
jgi:phage baseplate assembly protein W